MKLAFALSHILALLSATAIVTAAPSPAVALLDRDAAAAFEHSLVARACTSSTQCASTKYCDNGTCRTKLPLNATCRKDQQCISSLCFSGKCTSSTSRPNGAACTASTSCVSGNCQNSVCAAKKSAGGACYKDANCASGSCDVKKGTCAAATSGGGGGSGSLLANGKACTTSPSCASGNCQNSVCAAKKSAGGACYKDANCASGSCDTAKGTCAAASATPTSTGLPAGNTGGGSVYVPTPTVRSARPTERAAYPSGAGETVDVDFTSPNADFRGDDNAIITRDATGIFLQVYVPEGESTSFTVPVNSQAAAVVVPRKRQEGSLPEGIIVNYKYQLASMTIADPMRTTRCYITTSFSSSTRDSDDFARPFGIENVDPAWKVSQAYGKYYEGDEPWTSITVKASCDAGVTAIFNTAFISHLDGPTPTVEDWYLTPTITPTANAEQFTNGGFETGDLTGWSGLLNAAVIQGTAPTYTYAGTHAAVLTMGGAAGQTATISQILSPLGASPQQRRQVGSGPAPLPFRNLLYSFSWRMKVLAFDNAGAANPSNSGCNYFFNFNGKRAGNNPIYLEAGEATGGWFQEGYNNYPLYYINNDVAKSFDFSVTCADGVSMSLAIDAFTMTPTYNN